jgi:ectoine hydroxylase-related dioxygenase (phytanoyl-CoA dioxygenase family)
MNPMPQAASAKTLTNQASWFQNMPWIDRQQADIDDYCKKHKEETFDLKQKLQDWRSDGVVIFESAINPADVDCFQAELDQLIEEPARFDLEMDLAGQRKPISQFSSEQLKAQDKLKFNNIHYISPAARKLSLAKPVVNFLRHIFQDTPCTMQTLCFNKGSQQPVHADFAFVHNQTEISFMAASWIPLEDIHKDSGPLAYYPGTHQVTNFGFYDFGNGEIILTDGKNLMSAQEFSDWLQRGIEKGDYERRIFLPKKGDVLIWHAAVLHEGTKILDTTKTRKSLVTHYTGRSKMPDSHKTFDDSGAVLEMQQNGGTVLKHRWVNYSVQLG